MREDERAVQDSKRQNFGYCERETRYVQDDELDAGMLATLPGHPGEWPCQVINSRQLSLRRFEPSRSFKHRAAGSTYVS